MVMRTLEERDGMAMGIQGLEPIWRLFRGLRQHLKRGLRARGVGHAEPAGNAAARETLVT